MKYNRFNIYYLSVFILLSLVFIFFTPIFDTIELILWNKKPETIVNKPDYIHGIHLTAWSAGSKGYRNKLGYILSEKGLNTITIAVKEFNGEVYIPGVKMAEEVKAYTAAMPDIESYLKYLKFNRIYTIARIVVFKDDIMARKKWEWAVKDKRGGLWVDKKGQAWLNPYCKEAWEYNFSVTEQCINLGFNEIQFDYIRFPSDGNISNCYYKQDHSSTTAVQGIVDFLREAKKRFKHSGINISVDVFGLTTSSKDDTGIGQNLVKMAEQVDFICPMVYPSHYPKGSYGIADPNSQPYKTVFIGLSHAVNRLGINAYKLRPYLQAFSIGYTYGLKEINEQIKALNDNNIFEWTLWNPKSDYSPEIFNQDFCTVRGNFSVNVSSGKLKAQLKNKTK